MCIRDSVVGDKDQHTHPSLPEKWRVKLHVAPQGAGQKQSLHIRHEAPRKLFVQERVGDSLLLAGLPPAQKGAAALIGEKDGPVLLLLEMPVSYTHLRATGVRDKVADLAVISIHALREEGDRSGVKGQQAPLLFLSTPSARRATRKDLYRSSSGEISIHALREEGDDTGPDALLNLGEFLSTPSARRATGDVVSAQHIVDISIHALREEGDVGHGIVVHRSGISIHALREEGDMPI